MAAKMKVLVISHEFPKAPNDLSGIAVVRQLLALRRVGVRLRVVSPVPYCPSALATTPERETVVSAPSSAVVQGMKVYHPRYLRLPGRAFAPFACQTYLRAISSMVKRLVCASRPDLIHAYTATPDGVAAARLGARLGIPVVCTLLGSDINKYPTYSRRMWSLTEYVLQKVSRSIAVSAALREKAIQLAGDRIACDVGYLGCNTRTYSFDGVAREELRAKLGIRKSEKVILSLGNLLTAKGIFDLLSAFETIAAGRSDVHLVYAGRGRDESRLSELVAVSEFSGRVHLVGSPKHRDIPGWYSVADVFTLPSHSEGLPQALLEAMSCSRPVVASSVGGIPEVVENGSSGVLVEPDDARALERALLNILENDSVREQMGLRGRRIVEDAFTWERSAETLLGIYRSVVRDSEGLMA